MKLYYSPGACSLSPHIVSRELGLPVELSKVTFSADGRTTEEGENFFQVNPRGGYVPALRLDDSSVLLEGPAIVQYLADQAPEKGLLPECSTRAYYDAISWMTFISTELHKGFSPLYGNPPEEEKAKIIDRLKKRIAIIEAALEGKEYLLGSTFSIADCYLYTILRWTGQFGIDLAAYPHTKAFVARIEKRSGVQQALSEEGLEPVA